MSGLNLTVTFSCSVLTSCGCKEGWQWSALASQVDMGERGGAECRMKLVGKTFPFKTLVTQSFSFIHPAAVDDSALAHDSRLVTTDFL